MSAEQTAQFRHQPSAGGQPRFTPDSANQALVLVRRVVTDIVADYARMMELRAEREQLAGSPGSADRIGEIDRDVVERVERLNGLQRELADIGCVLKDWASGLVDFPAKRGGRTVYLCWRLGEDEITHWHEVHAGFAGRQPIAPDDFA